MPPVTRALLYACVAVYLLQANVPLMLDWLALWPPGSGFAPWQLVTYSFLHGGLSHILFNMFGLYMLGSDVERLFGVTGTASGVAHFAYLGGMLGGWLMILWRRSNGPSSRY